MKRIFIIGYATLLFASVVYAQEETPAPPPVEPQVPAEHPGMSRSTPPSQAVVPVPVPMAPPKPNGPVQKSLVRITATSVDPDYKAPWNAGGLQRGVGAGFVISGNRIMTNAHVVANSRYITVERDGDPNNIRAGAIHRQRLRSGVDHRAGQGFLQEHAPGKTWRHSCAGVDRVGIWLSNWRRTDVRHDRNRVAS
jgi:hypothetical protein